jgi:hypothetical protein
MADEKQLLEDLKAKADLLGVRYSGNIGVERLKAKIDAHIAKEKEDSSSGDAVDEEDGSELMPGSDKYYRAIRAAEKAAREPVRCIITDLDQSDSDNPTIYAKVANSHFQIGVIIRKDVEQLVPKAIVNALRQKTMVKWRNAVNPITKRPTGNKTPYTVKRYAIQEISGS